MPEVPESDGSFSDFSLHQTRSGVRESRSGSSGLHQSPVKGSSGGRSEDGRSGGSSPAPFNFRSGREDDDAPPGYASGGGNKGGGSSAPTRVIRTYEPDGKIHRFQAVAIGDEARNFDFRAARPEGKYTTTLESVAHLIKSCLGGGVVAMHEAYKQAGLWTALGLNVVLGLAVSYLMYVLARSAQKAYGRTHVPTMSYPDLAEAALDIGPFPKLRKYSKVFRYIVDFTIVIDLMGSCCCYQVIIARSIKQLVESTEDVSTDEGTNIRIYIACLLIPCILLCMITTLKYLAPFSLIADIFILIVAIATVVYGSNAATVPPWEMKGFNSFAGLLEFMGVCVFSMEGVGVTLAIENHIDHPKNMLKVLWMGMTGVVALVMIVGFFGLWGFGEKSKSPVTLNFPWTTVTSMLKVSMVLMIYVTFALNFWVPFQLLWFYMQRRHDPDRFYLWERVYRAGFVLLITLVSVAFPEVSKLMGVIGALCLSNMGFIYPAFIELNLDWDDPGLGYMKWRLWKFTAIFIFALIILFIATASNIKELISSLYL